jgi:DNA segregation ATPase FtsK/SpoIIIE-like protein
MLMSLLHKRTPEELRMVLIDPKKVELKPYETLGKAYLATPIITESVAAHRALSALCGIMDKRYETIGEKGKRNIAEYNASDGVEKMPYYVVVIDEYADLMMTSGKEAELAICRLAQKARAVGIHLIISTQRPSATIVTGNIKVGAEKLTGNGDMLYFSGAELTRVQCAYVGVDEVVATCKEIGESYADYKADRELDSIVNPPKLELVDWARDKEVDDALFWCGFGGGDRLAESYFTDRVAAILQEHGIIGEKTLFWPNNFETRVSSRYGYPILVNKEQIWEMTHVLVDG